MSPRAHPYPQTASTVVMVRPAAFASNPEAAPTNAFQMPPAGDAAEIHRRALAEFDALAEALSARGVRVIVWDDPPEPVTPDAVFPNNWFSTHDDGTVIFYPMAVPSRRGEIRPRFIDELEADTGGRWFKRVDLRPLVAEGSFLEGTGSLVLERRSRVAFACRSARTTDAGIAAFTKATRYRSVVFDAADDAGTPYYHTNVMMSVGTAFSVVCAEAIAPGQRDAVLGELAAMGKEIIAITRAQAAGFAGNVLEVRTEEGEPLVVMSARAKASFREDQLARIGAAGGVVSVDLSTIEDAGGGSARCMLAEVFSPS